MTNPFHDLYILTGMVPSECAHYLGLTGKNSKQTVLGMLKGKTNVHEWVLGEMAGLVDEIEEAAKTGIYDDLPYKSCENMAKSIALRSGK